ncbi:MAG TPA: 5-formyltetrahydrofolate cyclo-ligase [Gammaproteobacteria bacterium]|nr:5-formyltetrahydrofolate cyclo-ligase [Gammaproteobacteria bacterium]
MNSVVDEKQAIRECLTAARRGLRPSERVAEATAIAKAVVSLPEWRTARRWFVYLSGPEEVDTTDLVDELLARPATEVYAPVIVSRGIMEARRLRDRSELRPGRFNIPAPLNGEAALLPFEAILTPGLGFTAAGERMGLGAGFYDRWFAAHPQGCRIALAYRCQIVSRLPTEDTDAPVHVLVTADGARRLNTPAGSRRET